MNIITNRNFLLLLLAAICLLAPLSAYGSSADSLAFVENGSSI